MFELPAVQAVVAPVPAAHALALHCLQCFTLLLGCGKELPMQLMQAVLTALALQPAAAEAPTAMQVCTATAHKQSCQTVSAPAWQGAKLCHALSSIAEH
jgi:hypothetical protein